MEIRIDNTITIERIEELKLQLNSFFDCDFSVVIDGTYVYFRDK